MADTSFSDKKHGTICNAEKLGQAEQLAKLKAKSHIFDEIKSDRYLAERYAERNNATLMNDRTQADILLKIKKSSLISIAKNLP